VPNENSPAQDSYHAFLIEIKERIHAANTRRCAVNLELPSPHWDIGRLIDQRQQGETWGRAVVESLANDLRAEFPGVGGFSAANLWRIKQLYEAYAKDEKLAPLVREISWTKNLVILERCKAALVRRRKRPGVRAPWLLRVKGTGSLADGWQSMSEPFRYLRRQSKVVLIEVLGGL
jgi:hypothetical protein